MNKYRLQRGQVLLIALLVLVVAMTVGLSVATRTVSTLRTSKASDSSQRAFAAAEAGIEQALTATGNTTLSGDLSNQASYATSVTQISGNEFLLYNGSFISKSDSADIWLSTYPDYTSPWSGNLTLYWGSASDVCIGTPESSNTMAALEVVLISGTSGNPVIDHFAYDPCATRRNSYNNFSSTSSGATVLGRNFAYSVTIPITSGLLARVIPIYAGTHIGVRGTGMPPQGTLITSIGTSGGTQRKIVSFRGYPKVPIELYPYLIFSPN